MLWSSKPEVMCPIFIGDKMWFNVVPHALIFSDQPFWQRVWFGIGWEVGVMVNRRKFLTQSPGEPGRHITGARLTHFLEPQWDEVYRLTPEPPLFLENADGARGIFVLPGCVLATPLRLDPPKSQPCAILACLVEGVTNIFTTKMGTSDDVMVCKLD